MGRWSALELERLPLARAAQFWSQGWRTGNGVFVGVCFARQTLILSLTLPTKLSERFSLGKVSGRGLEESH